MIYVGIDVAKHKHDCCILDAEGKPLRSVFTFQNNKNGFEALLAAIQDQVPPGEDRQIKAGLEATGHYSENLMAFLRASGIEPVAFNPLQVNLYRKAFSLRKTKTDKVDARCIAELLRSDESNPVPLSYQTQELKILTRHRVRLVTMRSKAKIQLTRLIDILFPELPTLCWSTTQKSMLALLKECPGSRPIASCHTTRLTNILKKHSNGRYGQEKALAIKALARQSIGRESQALSFELQQVIDTIEFAQQKIDEVDREVRMRVQATNTPLLTVPGIGHCLAAIILAEIGDISRFASPDKLLAFAGLEPSMYQSGKFTANHTPMTKRGSTYLRWALMQAARLVTMRCTEFKVYQARKLAQGKHYFTVLGHVAKKLVRVIFHILTTNEPYIPQSV